MAASSWKPGSGLALLVVLVAVVGCATSTPTDQPAQAQLPTPIPTDIPAEPTEANGPPESGVDNPAPTSTVEFTEEPPSEPTPVPGRPDAPAPIDGDFRPDPVAVVAATGRPQLLEFFTFW